MLSQVMTSTTDTTTPDALLRRGDFGLGGISQYQQNFTLIPDVTQFFTQSITTSAPDGINGDGNWWHYIKMVSPDPNLTNRPRAMIGVKTHNSGGYPINPELWVMGVQPDGNPTRQARAYTNKNIVGDVSQSAGVPTGAIIQRGSNANGQFTRFADGSQVCRISLITVADVGTDWTFPIAFANIPNISGTAVTTTQTNGEVIPRILCKNLYTNSSVKLYIFRAVNDNEVSIPRVAGSADVTAFGYWY